MAPRRSLFVAIVMAQGQLLCSVAQAQEAPTQETPAKEAPAPEQSTSVDDADETDRGTVQGIGLAPTVPQSARDTTSLGSTPTVTQPTTSANEFGFHGFMRAPMRIGWGPRNDGSPGTEWHAPQRTPDLSFTRWEYLDSLAGPWAEMMFSYGNKRSTVHVSVAGYNQTIAGYRDLQSQLGINQAFVSVQFPDVFGRFGGLKMDVGSFSNRYGTAGKYDAGKYETYLFGRTRVAGETSTARLYLSTRWVLSIEHGVGAKIDVVPFASPMPRPEYLPYGGPEPQGSTFVHHAHASLSWVKGKRNLTFGGHYLTSWTPDDRNLAGTMSQEGRMTVSGAEIKLNGEVLGDAYLGFSHVNAQNIRGLADGVEVLHSLGGYQFKNNYFGRFDPVTRTTSPDESGSVNTLLFQYTVSLGQIARYPARFWGNGPDLVASVFGMYNAVTSASNNPDKLKFGGEVLYTPLANLAIGARYDLVQPNLSNSDESFSVISPRLVLRTAFLSHERITLQYSRYFYGPGVSASFPFESAPGPDTQALMVSASMWW